MRTTDGGNGTERNSNECIPINCIHRNCIDTVQIKGKWNEKSNATPTHPISNSTNDYWASKYQFNWKCNNSSPIGTAWDGNVVFHFLVQLDSFRWNCLTSSRGRQSEMSHCKWHLNLTHLTRWNTHTQMSFRCFGCSTAFQTDAWIWKCLDRISAFQLFAGVWKFDWFFF